MYAGRLGTNAIKAKCIPTAVTPWPGEIDCGHIRLHQPEERCSTSLEGVVTVLVRIVVRNDSAEQLEIAFRRRHLFGRAAIDLRARRDERLGFPTLAPLLP